MTAAVLTSFLLGFGIYTFLKDTEFGRQPKGEWLRRIRASPNFRKGQFRNLSPTPSLTEGANFGTVLKTFLLNREKNRFPKKPIPSQKTNLHKLPPEENILVWFGHSSYFLQFENKKILVDPVFSGSASPTGGARAFMGTDRYTVADMPEIDYLFITHDHWDHLDHKTISDLRPCIRKVIFGLGSGEHLEYWVMILTSSLRWTGMKSFLWRMDPGFMQPPPGISPEEALKGIRCCGPPLSC